MIRRIAILALLALATGPALADPATDTNFPLRVRYWQNYRSRQRTTRYGYPPTGGTNQTDTAGAGPPVPTSVLDAISRETVRGMLAPPEGAAQQSGEVWLDCLAIPEGSWLVERPVAGGGTAWCAALCENNALRAVVWRYAEGVGPTNLPGTIEHDATRPIGRVEGLYYEQGTGVVARISVSRAGWDWARTNRCVSPSPWIRCADTNLVVRTDGWRHEHQDYIEARCVPRGEDCSYTNVPASTSCLVLYPLYFRGLSLVRTPLLPTYVEREVPDHLRSAYPVNPRRQWDWR